MAFRSFHLWILLSQRKKSFMSSLKPTKLTHYPSNSDASLRWQQNRCDLENQELVGRFFLCPKCSPYRFLDQQQLMSDFLDSRPHREKARKNSCSTWTCVAPSQTVVHECPTRTVTIWNSSVEMFSADHRTKADMSEWTLILQVHLNKTS